MTHDRTLLLTVITAGIAGAAGLILPNWALFLVTVAIGKALVVLGLLLLWRAGLVSFGQALFFAGGAYAAGLLARSTGITDAFVLLATGAVSGALLAFVIGFLLARYREIFFAMLSLAFSMILYGVLVKTEALGSTDGIGFPTPSMLGFDTGGEHFVLTAYGLAIFCGLAAAVAAQLYLRSIPGKLDSPVRDNEVRVEYLGMSVQYLVHLKLIIAGTLAGTGGVLTAIAIGHIDPEMAYWTTSGGFVFITILAGTGSVLAPFLGALLFEAVRSFAMEYVPEFWQIILGSALLAAIFFLPEGLWSLFRIRRRST